MLRIRCPQCNKRLKIDFSLLSRRVVCPACKTKFVPTEREEQVYIPSTPPPPRQRAAPEPEPAEEFEDPEEFEVPEPQAESISWSAAVGVASIACAALSGSFIILPCFWMFALPFAVLGVLLGFVGLILATRFRRNAAWAIVGLVLSICLGAVSFLSVAHVQLELHKAFHQP